MLFRLVNSIPTVGNGSNIIEYYKNIDKTSKEKTTITA